MDIDEGIDLLNLLLWAVIGIVSVVFCYGQIARNLQAYSLPDKSTVIAARDNTPEPYQWYVRDYILMLMVADEFEPEPAAVDIKFGDSQEDTLVKFDANYLKNMEGMIQRYYINYLNTRVDQPIVSYDYYYEGTGDNGRWRFKTQ